MVNDNQFAIFWLKQIKEKYIHGGDEGYDSCRKRAIDIAIKELEKPNEIVRCKDCKHWDADEHDCNIKTGWFSCGADWFCADGERKEGDGE